MAELVTESMDRKKSRRGKKKPRPAEIEVEASEAGKKPEETPMEFLGSIAAVFVIGLFIITFIVQAFEIPSASMKDTLLIGDHVFVDRERFAPATDTMRWLMPYGAPHRGDIFVFLSVTNPGMYLVKRVRGVPGDRIHLREGRLYVNGQLQDEPFVKRNGSYAPYRDNFPLVPASDYDQVTAEWQATMGQFIDKGGDLVVPPGHYFAMGDNRDNSYDSRYWGFVPQENIIGRPLFIYWSFETPEDQYAKTALTDRLGFVLHIVTHFLTETRWNRTLKMVR